MLLPLLMNLEMLGEGGEPPVAPPAAQETYSGGWYDPRNGVTRKEREEQVRKDRIKFGLIPDDVPEKAVAILEREAAKSMATLEIDPDELRMAFQDERVRWRKAYEEYYRAFYDALVTLELQRYYQQRRKRLMVFVLMNS